MVPQPLSYKRLVLWIEDTKVRTGVYSYMLGKNELSPGMGGNYIFPVSVRVPVHVFVPAPLFRGRREFLLGEIMGMSKLIYRNHFFCTVLSI